MRISPALIVVSAILCSGNCLLAQRIVAPAPTTGAPSASSIGILLMAHGGGKDWDGKVKSVAADVDQKMPTEVALGMADRATLQAGVDNLIARGV